MRCLSPAWFTVAFSLSYIVVFALDLALFLYYPLRREFHLSSLSDPSAGPAMHWYGLLASATCIGLLASLLLRDHWIPARLTQWLWLTPVSTMLASLYLLRHFFV